ncbi:MAG: MAPEG family protein [Xanthomonadales bacterium]|nr:MAPEG family protein [Xanthomonadales bacterium]MCB1627045.1 MAPEG family protein [Xanthomonadales bacterium]
MSWSYLCVLIAGLLPLLSTGYAKFAGPGFDNRHPRDFLAGLTGARARAHAAQLNGFEAFPLFAAAVLMAHQAGVDSGRIDLLAIIWVLLRLAYGVLYIANRATLRSLAWAGASAIWIALMVMAMLARS